MYRNKKDQKRCSRLHYERNKDKIKLRARIFSDKMRLVLKGYVAELKSKPCSDCGRIYPPCVMDFDHREGTEKCGNVSIMVNVPVSFETLKSEIEKCDVVCANCHRIRTHIKRK